MAEMTGMAGTAGNGDAAPPERRPTDDPRTRLLLLVGSGVVVMLAAVVGLLARLDDKAPHLVTAQRATPESIATEVGGHLEELRTWLYLDDLLILAYTGLGVLVFTFFWVLTRNDNGRRRTAGMLVGGSLVVLAGIADLVENRILRSVISHDRLADVSGSTLGAMRAFGLVKVLLLVATFVALLLLLLTRERDPYVLGLPGTLPEDADGNPPAWAPPGKGEPARVGVCLSGGGIRSAAFALGGMQALQDHGVLDETDYVAAASGGGYLAAGWALTDAERPEDGTPGASPRPWSRGSPEERWFRDHSSYLVPDLLGGLRGVGRILAGVAINVVLIWLLLFVIARPVGWVISEIHPELRAQEPVAIPTDATGQMVIDKTPLDDRTIADGVPLEPNRYQIPLAPAPADAAGGTGANQVCFDTAGFNKGEDLCFPVVGTRPVTVAVDDGEAEVVRQPRVKATREGSKQCPEPGSAAASLPADRLRLCQEVFDRIEIVQQPKVTLSESAVSVLDSLPNQLKVSTQPALRTRTGLVSRPDLTLSWWMWELVLLPLSVAALIGLAMMTLRTRGSIHRTGRFAAITFAVTGLLCFAVAIALPKLILWLPTIGKNVTLSDAKLSDFLLPSGGLIALGLAAARQLLSSNRVGKGTGPAGPTKPESSDGIFSRAWARLTKGSPQLGWYELSPLKVLLGLLIMAAFVTFFVTQMQYASANGIRGRLLGVPFIRTYIPNWLWWEEWLRWVAVIALLVGFAAAVDAHVWSLYPFYKRALSSGYLVRRNGDRAEARPYDELIPLTPDPEDTEDPWPGLVGSRHRPGKRKRPVLVLCCSVNLSEYSRVPPGRRAASFTFGPDFIGGPLVGYQPAEKFWEHLPRSRRRDITLPSAMAISGAAFSPAMGKKNLGPVGSVLAIANLRLGVWIPHPQRVTAANRGRWHTLQRPGWLWFMREVTNSYKFQRRYLYVSDGGHWENLGLVELLRRGCTDIICISAAGDGAAGFGTIAEAMALAREELGVEWNGFDPTPLRPPIKAADPVPTRELRRPGSKGVNDPYAPSAFTEGTFQLRGGVTGRLRYIETAITADLPFDVHGFAESEAIFPDDSTADQVFNHRQFEAFRALGYHQVGRAVAPPTPTPTPTPPLG